MWDLTEHDVAVLKRDSTVRIATLLGVGDPEFLDVNELVDKINKIDSEFAKLLAAFHSAYDQYFTWIKAQKPGSARGDESPFQTRDNARKALLEKCTQHKNARR